MAQGMPDRMNLSADGHRIVTGSGSNNDFYNIDSIRTIHLIFPTTSWASTLASNYGTDYLLGATMIYNGDTLASQVGVQYRGQTSYMMNTAIKKSFNIAIDFEDPEQDINNFENLNLNCGFQDASFMREALMENLIQKYIPGLAVNWVNLYINGADYGLYTNVQQLNGDYLKDWFLTNNGTRWRAEKTIMGPGPGGGFGAGQSSLNYLGVDSSDYTPYYQLKKTSKANPWEDLIECADALNNTPLSALEDNVVNYLDLDRALWHIACEIIFSDDDSYIHKGGMDYYVYWEPETDRITPLEYDANSVMNDPNWNWSPFYKEADINFPLQNKLLAVPALCQRYLAHVRTIMEETFNPTFMEDYINYYDGIINAAVNADPVKIYTYSQYLTDVANLKTFVENRHTFYQGNVEINQVGLTISNTLYKNAGLAWDAVDPGESVVVNTSISGGGISGVNLYYGTGLVGLFTKVMMYDDGTHSDGAAGDGVYGANIPGYAAATDVRFYIQAIKNNTPLTQTYDPPGAEHDVYYYKVTGTATDIEGESSDLDNILSAYPNPSNGKFMIHGLDYNKEITLYNSEGKLLEQFYTNAMLLDFSKYTVGMYYLHNGDNRIKLMIQ